MKDNVIGTALAKELCVICCTEMDGPILINTKLSKSQADKVNKMHGQVIGFADKPCDKCQENMSKAFLFIGFDEEQSDMDNLPGGFYRTGHIIGVKKESLVVTEFVKENNPNAIKKGFMFTPYSIMKQLGLI